MNVPLRLRFRTVRVEIRDIAGTIVRFSLVGKIVRVLKDFFFIREEYLEGNAAIKFCTGTFYCLQMRARCETLSC